MMTTILQHHQYKDFELSDDDNHSTAPPVQAPTTNAPSTLALPAEHPQKKPAFQMSAPKMMTTILQHHRYKVMHQLQMPLPEEPPQKKQMTAHEVRVLFCSFALSYPPCQCGRAFVVDALPCTSGTDFEVSDDDNHSIAPPVQGNAPTTNVASTLALPVKPPQKKPAFQMSTLLGFII
ncbi:hypothetical protein Tco_1330942 [Tanacetum coccineum]